MPGPYITRCSNLANCKFTLYKTRTITKPSVSERSMAPHSEGRESKTELVANHSQCEKWLLLKSEGDRDKHAAANWDYTKATPMRSLHSNEIHYFSSPASLTCHTPNLRIGGVARETNHPPIGSQGHRPHPLDPPIISWNSTHTTPNMIEFHDHNILSRTWICKPSRPLVMLLLQKPKFVRH